MYFQPHWGTTESPVAYITPTKVSKAKPGRSDFLPGVVGGGGDVALQSLEIERSSRRGTLESPGAQILSQPNRTEGIPTSPTLRQHRLRHQKVPEQRKRKMDKAQVSLWFLLTCPSPQPPVPELGHHLSSPWGPWACTWPATA